MYSYILFKIHTHDKFFSLINLYPQNMWLKTSEYLTEIQIFHKKAKFRIYYPLKYIGSVVVPPFISGSSNFVLSLLLFVSYSLGFPTLALVLIEGSSTPCFSTIISYDSLYLALFLSLVGEQQLSLETHLSVKSKKHCWFSINLPC